MKKQIPVQVILERIYEFSQPFRKPLMIVFGCILTVTAVDALNSWCFSRIFNLIQSNGLSKDSAIHAYGFIGGGITTVLIRIIIVSFQGVNEIKKIDLKMTNYLNHESISKFFSFSSGQHINEHSGVKQSIVNSGTTSIQNQINLALYQFFPAVSQLIIALIVLFYAQWAIGLIFVGIGIIFSGMMYNINQKLVPGVRKMRDRRQINARLISELYRFVSLVKKESQEKRSLHELSTAQEKHQNIFTETWIPQIFRLSKVRSSTAIIRYGAMFYAVYLLSQNSISAGNLFLVFTWSSYFVNSLWMLMDIHKQFMLDRVNIEKYFELLEVKADIIIPENSICIENLQGNIEFKNVSFWYPKRVKSYEDTSEDSSEEQDDPVLKNISFKVASGEKIGIVGESGSGKSTLANLLQRGFDPQEGQILIDGHDLRLIDLNLFLRQVGSVEQEVAMFDRSIRDNILFGLDDQSQVTEEDLKKLAKIARIDAFFSRLEHGFDTIVGEKGVKLSGGERQRVGIARALAKNPNVLIFDEATSALDSMSERIVQESIDDACKGKTSIIIAHRLSTVRNCDRILVFRHGLLLAEGTHDQLLDTCEYYADLVSHQMAA